MSSPLMLVSARADARLRADVAAGTRPRPEYLMLESSYGVELLDWSRLPGQAKVRSRWRSSVHVATALAHVRNHDVVFSDGEHVGIPLALAMRGLGISIPHLVIGHHLTSRAKIRLLQRLRAHDRMTRILVHSHRQQHLAHHRLGIPESKLAFVPYYADTEFWRPAEADEERLVVAAGREHRDYAILAEACGELDARVFVASGSVHSPAATSTRYPQSWPANFARGYASYMELRELYSKASVVVVPVVETDFQAGVTTLLEAMSCGKAVVMTATSGHSGVVQDGLTGICVPPGCPSELRDAVRFLLDNPRERARLGRSARDAVLDMYSLEIYAERLAGHLTDLATPKPAAA